MDNTTQSSNTGNFYDDYGDLKYYDEKIKIRKKRIKMIIVLIAIFLVLSISFTLFFFTDYTLSYDEMYGGIKPVTSDGYVFFDCYASDSETTWGSRGDATSTVVYDYENGVAYSYGILQLTAQRWHIWFNKGVHRLEYKFCSNGKPYGMAEWKFNPDFDYKSDPRYMDERYIRLYYNNPDGTCVLIWELPEAQEIADRLGIELPELDSFQSNIRDRR